MLSHGLRDILVRLEHDKNIFLQNYGVEHKLEVTERDMG
jgi:hypothetical protein